jgi:hypothetical protein
VELLLELDLFFVVRLGFLEQQLLGEVVLRADHCKASIREFWGEGYVGTLLTRQEGLEMPLHVRAEVSVRVSSGRRN